MAGLMNDGAIQTADDGIHDRAMIKAAVSRLNELEKELRLVRGILEPLSGKKAKARLVSKDGRHDYTKTSSMFRRKS